MHFEVTHSQIHIDVPTSDYTFLHQGHAKDAEVELKDLLRSLAELLMNSGKVMVVFRFTLLLFFLGGAPKMEEM